MTTLFILLSAQDTVCHVVQCTAKVVHPNGNNNNNKGLFWCVLQALWPPWQLTKTLTLVVGTDRVGYIYYPPQGCWRIESDVSVEKTGFPPQTLTPLALISRKVGGGGSRPHQQHGSYGLFGGGTFHLSVDMEKCQVALSMHHSGDELHVLLLLLICITCYREIEGWLWWQCVQKNCKHFFLN